jgi:hypothetical protein
MTWLWWDDSNKISHWDVRVWTGCYSRGLDRELMAISCEQGIEPSGSIKGGKYLDRMKSIFSRRTLLQQIG